MKTLIFKRVRDYQSRFGRGTKIEFVKEGDFVEAMNYFDDTYNVFETTEDNECFDPSIDEKGYYTDSSGDVIVTFSDLENSKSHICEVDSSAFINYYTTESNDLTDDELLAYSKNHDAEDVFIENGYSKLHFRLAEYFKDFERLIENGNDYIDYFDALDNEPENDDSFPFEDKFYIKNA